LIVKVKSCVSVNVPSLATTLNAYEDFASKFGLANNVTTPEELIAKNAASAPDNEYVTVSNLSTSLEVTV
jgi:hypothetical protein